MGNTGIQGDGESGYLISGANRDNFGYKVIEVKKGSPAHKSGLEPFLDYVVYTPKLAEDGCSTLLFSEFLIENIGKHLVLHVYNMIQLDIRLIHLDLTTLAYDDQLKKKLKQPGVSVQEELLGAKMRYE